MKFIHAADLHLDSPLRGLDSYQGAPAERIRGASREALTRLIDLALEEKVAFVLIAGDLYDGDWKDFSTGQFFVNEIARLSQAQIPSYLIRGNHDSESGTTKALTLPQGVYEFSTRSFETKVLDDLPLPVAIHGRSFPNRHIDENWALEYPAPLPGHLNIGLLHTSVQGAPSDNGNHPSYAPCALSDLTAKGYDYWALGHIHKPQVLNKFPWVVYSGNIQGRSVRELGPRGARLVDVDENNGQIISCEQVELDVARWGILEIDLTPLSTERELFEQLSNTFKEQLAQADGRLLCLRLQLSGQIHPDLADLLSNPSHLRAEIQSLATRTDSEQLWIEKIHLCSSAGAEQEQGSLEEINEAIQTTLREDLPLLLDQEMPADLSKLSQLLTAEGLPAPGPADLDQLRSALRRQITA